MDFLFKIKCQSIERLLLLNLALFLQTRNPNVPDIPNKLIKPAIRNGLTKQTNEYWKLVFKELGSINCIFTDTKLYFDERNYALDHFGSSCFCFT